MKDEISVIPKKTQTQILADPKVSMVVQHLRKHHLDVDITPDTKHFVRAIFVIGSFTNPEECNIYSDIDLVVLAPLSLFKDQSALSRIKNTLHDIESQIRSIYPEPPDLYIWPKPIEWYENLRPFMQGDLFDSLWLYKHQDERENYYSSSSPYDLFALDGWSGLASDILLHYEKATSVTLYGWDVFSAMKLPETIHKHEWFELALVASRDLAIGFAQRADGWEAIRQNKQHGETLIRRGERQIGKAVLRMFYAQEILETGRPLNTYKAIRDWVFDRYSTDDRITELADNAYRAKVLLERTFLCSTAGLFPIVRSNSEMTVVAPIANLFSLTIGMKEHFIYPKKGFIHIPFKPGVREFYWEKTLPNTIRQLAERDINPLILTIFIPEIRDYLVRDLSYLKERGIKEEQISDGKTTANAISILERCIWFYISYDHKTGGSAYDWFQMSGPFGIERVKKIDAIAQDILYKDDQFLSRVFAQDRPEWLENKIIKTIDTLAGVLAHYGTEAFAQAGNELVTQAFVLYEKMVSVLGTDRLIKKYSDLHYEYMIRLGRILTMHIVPNRGFLIFGEAPSFSEDDRQTSIEQPDSVIDISNRKQAAMEVEKAIFWFEKAIGLYPNKEAAYYHLGETYRTLNMPEHAEEILEKALQVDPSFVSVLALLIDLYEVPPLSSKKFDAIQKCWELEGKNPAAKLGIVKLTFPSGLDESRAQVWLNQALEGDDNWYKIIDHFKSWRGDLLIALLKKSAQVIDKE